ASAERSSSPREQYPAVAPPAAPAVPAAARRSSTAVRIAAEVARQTRGLRRSSKVLIGVLVIALGALGWNQWQRTQDTRDLSRLQARADSLNHEARRLLARFESELESVRDALRQSQAEVARLRSELAAAGRHGDVARLRTELDAAEARQRGLAGAAAIDYRAIAKHNQDAIALLVVRFSAVEMFSGTAFAVDSGGTLVTNKHLLVGERGDRRPQAIAVKFAGSKQWFPGRFVGVADTGDVGVLHVDLRGGTPRVLGFAHDPGGLQRGDPVAIIGYPLGEDLPMERAGQAAVADPTLTVGTVSKVLANLVQLDGYGAPGSSGSPIFDRRGRVVAVLYGGNRQSQGRIVYGVPAAYVVTYLRELGASFPLQP
ncbi:MAG: trypsin-like peptidase domain-containing protein, partial [Gemmatimonadales bacterium]